MFATALSKRVSEWIRTTDPLSEIVNTPKPGTLMGERLAKERSVKRVGVLEYDTLPSGLADDMAAAAPAVEWTDGTALFTGLRREVDDAERGLLARADAMAVAALREAETGKAKDAGTLAGLIEQTRGSPARRKPISRSRPISSPTGGSTAPRSRRPWRTASRCAPPSPTRAAGCAARARLRRTAAPPRPMRGSTASCVRSKPASRSRRRLPRR